METIQLNFFESTILNKIKSKQEVVLMIPIDIYATLLLYCEQTEQYETCIILRELQDRVTDKTLAEYFEEYDREYKSQQKLLKP